MPIRELVRRLVRDGNLGAVLIVAAAVVTALLIHAAALYESSRAIDELNEQSRVNYQLLLEIRAEQSDERL